jgi:hypothetical protein
MHVEEVPLEVSPAEEVFDLRKKVLAEETESTMEEFVDNLRATLNTQAAKSLLDEIRASDAPDEIRERAIFYLEKAGAR